MDVVCIAPPTNCHLPLPTSIATTITTTTRNSTTTTILMMTMVKMMMAFILILTTIKTKKVEREKCPYQYHCRFGRFTHCLAKASRLSGNAWPTPQTIVLSSDLGIRPSCTDFSLKLKC